MKLNAIIAFGCSLLIQAGAQDAPTPQASVQCKFSDGTKITVTYSSERKNYRLVTDGELLTAKGITVPPGDYRVVRGWDRYGHFLILQKATETPESSQLPRLPMSSSTLSMPQKKDAVSFVSTGGSCTMQLASENSSTLFSLEFAKKNTDLPVMK